VAVLIPDDLRSRKDVPPTVRRVAGALGVALDGDVTIWYEPLFDRSGTRPDLVVLDPRYGLLIVEVLKGDGRSRLLGAINGQLRVVTEGRESFIPAPSVRGEQFAEVLRQAIGQDPRLADIPVGVLTAFTTMTRENAESKQVGTVVDLDRSLFKDDLEAAISNAEPTFLLRAFARATDGSLSRALGEDQITALRALVHPESVVQPRPSQGSLFSAAALDGDVIKVMDRQQERVAKSLGSGHRVIRGVAGSGKTLVLVHRAKLLSRYLPNRRILVTCYTRALASQLRKELADCPNVEVSNLDRLMDQTMRDAGVEHPGYGHGAKPVANAALGALDKLETPKFHAVLVDEAQDLDLEALQFCIRLLESSNPDEQDLVIVADSAQNIFKKNFRWSDAGVRAVGRTRVLRVNYRNTRQILSFAYDFLTADDSIVVQSTLDQDDEAGVIPAEASKRSGAVPQVIEAADMSDEVEKVVAAVKDLYSERSPARSIAVIYGEQPKGSAFLGAALADALDRERLPHLWVTDPEAKDNRDLAGETDFPIVLSTIHSAKGLEFKSVVVCGLGARDDRVTARKLAYVGMTRAVDELIVVVGAESPFRRDLLALARSQG
jgi:hypothetical protein